MKKTRYYRSYEDDFEQSSQQDYKVPEDYRWVRSPFLSTLIYALAFVISSVCCRLFLHVRFQNRKTLKETKKTGAFVYANHTQPVGDVFDPALACFPNRIYTLVSPANLGIPFLGKLLPYLGALPIPDSLKGMKKLSEAIEHRLNQKKCVVIYPEAHVWAYYTKIRPFPETSFKFPVKHQKPVYCLTAAYRKRRLGKKPAITIFCDGPFHPNSALSPKEQASDLRDRVYACMEKRSQSSNCEYIVYEKIDSERNSPHE